MKWFALSAAALVLVLVLLIGLRLRKPAAPEQPAVTTSTATDAGGCRVQEKLALTPQPNAEGPPLVIYSEGDARVFIDGAAEFSGLEAPKHFKVGEHTLKVETKTSQPIVANFRLDPWKPALLFIPAEETLGILLIRSDAQCSACQRPIKRQTLDYVKGTNSTEYALIEAAKSLRAHDWNAAGELLRSIPVKERSDRRFKLLAAAYFSEVSQPDDVAASLQALAKTERVVATLVGRLAELRDSERQRRHEVLLARWNKLTERYAALVARFEPQVRPTMQDRARRFEQLSNAFTTAAETKNVVDEDELVRAALLNVTDLVDAIRSSAPDDCAFQASVVATALQ